VKKVSKLLIK